MEVDDIWWLLVLAVVLLAIGITFGAKIATHHGGTGASDAERVLGTAICDQEYDMDFDHYDWSDDTLHCKPREQHYDGLKVELGGRDYE